MSTIENTRTFEDIAGVRIELERRGQGTPLVVLCSEEALELDAPFLDELARDHELIIPSPPGFGKSDRPDWVTSTDDIAYILLDLVERLKLGKCPVLGFSLGGWIALQMAVKDDSFFSQMVLVDPYGVKIGGPTDRDVQDIWTLHPDKVAEFKWADRDKGKRDFASMSEDELGIVARNIETFARFCWEPYMHDPKLKHRLHRVAVPTLFVWGENDGIVSPAYGLAFSKLVPGAQFATIPKAGHYPQIEQPQAVLQHVRKFIG